MKKGLRTSAGKIGFCIIAGISCGEPSAVLPQYAVHGIVFDSITADSAEGVIGATVSVGEKSWTTGLGGGYTIDVDSGLVEIVVTSTTHEGTSRTQLVSGPTIVNFGLRRYAPFVQFFDTTTVDGNTQVIVHVGDLQGSETIDQLFGTLQFMGPDSTLDGTVNHFFSTWAALDGLTMDLRVTLNGPMTIYASLLEVADSEGFVSRWYCETYFRTCSEQPVP